MRPTGPVMRAAAITLLMMLFTACNSNAPPTDLSANDSAALNDLAEAYRLYQIAKNAPPRKPADLQTVETIGGNGVAQARSGEIEVVWGAKLPDTKEEPGQSEAPEILAYGKNVPKDGGFVLRLDRTVAKMTAEEFQAAPKAAGNPAPTPSAKTAR